jgi:hypothetical protein
MQPLLSRSLRRAYREWVEQQIESYKDEVARGELLDLADEVCRELRVTQDGQYQITELLLCAAMDRRIFRLLRLPGYRAWCARYAQGGDPVISSPPEAAVPEPPARISIGRISPRAVEVNDEPRACVA